MSAAPSPARRKQIEALLARRNARYVTVGVVDHFGQLRGQLLGREAFASCLRAGVPFLPATMAALDVGDQILPSEGAIEMNMPFADEPSRIVVEAPRRLPFYPLDGDLFFFAETTPDNSGHGYDTRAVYHRAAGRLDALGLRPVQGFEYEFRLFQETAHSATAKGFDDLVPFVPSSGYMSILQQSNHVDFLFGLLDACETLEVPIAGVHFEHGRAMLEVALGPAPSITAPDNATLFKTFAKVHAARQGALASFMAKPNPEEDGGCLHTHISLLARNGRNAFHAPREPHTLSATLRHFVGGILALLPELFLMAAPNPNSMRRFVVDHFAPVGATWGIQNRTTAVRVIPSGPRGQRIEFRVPGADANPYLVLALALGAGAWGIERKLEPPSMVERSSYLLVDQLPKRARFPTSFVQAIDRFDRSKAARELFGESFVSAFAGARRSQWDELKGRRGGAALQAERARFLIGV